MKHFKLLTGNYPAFGCSLDTCKMLDLNCNPLSTDKFCCESSMDSCNCDGGEGGGCINPMDYTCFVDYFGCNTNIDFLDGEHQQNN